ncbi:MAG: hypothetical protein GY754_44740 [bacterium]|nr:hypothetical protein [bacterium]
MIDLLKNSMPTQTNKAESLLPAFASPSKSQFNTVLQTKIHEIKGLNDNTAMPAQTGNESYSERYSNSIKNRDRSEQDTKITKPEEEKTALKPDNSSTEKPATGEEKSSVKEAAKEAKKETGEESVNKTDKNKEAEKTGRLSLEVDADELPGEEIENLLEGINRLIDIFETVPEKSNDLKELKDIKELLTGTLNQQKNTSLEKKMPLLKQALAELKSLLEKSTNEKIPVSFDEKTPLKNISTFLKNLMDRLVSDKGGRYVRNRHIPVDAKHANTDTAATTGTSMENKTILDISDSGKGEGFSHSSGDENGSAKQGFGLNMSRNSAFSTKAGSPQTMDSQFRNQLRSVIDNAKVVVKDSKNASYSVKLFPRSLGSLNVTLGLEQGVVTGRFLVDTPEAKDLLMANLAGIKDQLAEEGLTVGEFEVNVRDQREQFSAGTNENEERNHYIVPQSDTVLEAENVYDANSGALHNGAINMVI